MCCTKKSLKEKRAEDFREKVREKKIMSDVRVFKRYEKKYMLTKEQYEGFFNDYRKYLVPDEYHENFIQNIYYDTPNYRLIRDSIDKPFYKEKLRLRCYNEIRHGQNVYLEIKKKYDGIVYKRREKINIEDVNDFIMKQEKQPDSQIGKELTYFLKYYGELKPAMYLAYHRKAWVGTEDEGLRITFDTDSTWRIKDVDFFAGSDGNKLFKEGTVLMEVKCGEALPPEMVKLFNKYEIYPTSFSKYGAAYATLAKEAAKQAAELAMAAMVRRVRSGNFVAKAV